MDSNFQSVISESRYERKRKYKMIESIRDSANTIHSFLDAMGEPIEETEILKNLEVRDEESSE